MLTDYCPSYSRVPTCDKRMPTLKAAAGDIALLTAVGRMLVAGLENLLRESVGWQFKFEVLISRERIDELMLLLVRPHCEYLDM